MAIATYNPAALAAAFSATPGGTDAKLARVMRLAMTPRVYQLNHYKAHYDAEPYDDRVVAWNGTKVLRADERPAVMGQTVPAHDLADVSKYDAVPLDHRRPDVEVHTVREVVNGFSDLLFGDEATPTVEIVGDPAATAWLASMIDATAFWSRWLEARDDAGAMGSTAITFKFVAGRLEIEVHDPRWCEPVMGNPATGDISALEIRWPYPVDEPNPMTGKIETAWKWYRRVITADADTTYLPTPADPEVEPTWDPDPALTFAHGLGVFPGCWVQNQKARGRIDGPPDCKGLFGNVEVEDQLLTQSSVGARNNADPTLHMGVEDVTLGALRKGSNHAIKTGPADKVGYVEMSGSGVKVALEVADAIDKRTLRDASYIRLADRVNGSMTATEVLRVCAPMYASVRRRRQHWGPSIVALVERIVRATRKLTQPTVAAVAQPDGSIVNVATAAAVNIPLPPSLMTGQLEDQGLAAAAFAIKLKWPPVVAPTVLDAQQAVAAAAAARGARIIDRRTAVEYVAPLFPGVDVDTVIAALDAEDAAMSSGLESSLLAAQPDQVADHATPPAPAPAPSAPPSDEPAKEAMTGVQINALVLLAEKSYSGALPREAVLAQAWIAFPSADPDYLDKAIPYPPPTPSPVVAAALGQATPPADPSNPPAPRGAP